MRGGVILRGASAIKNFLYFFLLEDVHVLCLKGRAGGLKGRRRIEGFERTKRKSLDMSSELRSC